MPELNFEIFLKFLYFLKSQVLSRLTTREVTCNTVCGDNNKVPFHLWERKARLKDKKILSVFCEGL